MKSRSTSRAIFGSNGLSGGGEAVVPEPVVGEVRSEPVWEEFGVGAQAGGNHGKVEAVAGDAVVVRSRRRPSWPEGAPCPVSTDGP